jgi:ribonuclease BN (tRNA processing enzyme)
VFLTDNELGFTHENGLTPAAYARACAGADLMFHDAEYTPEEYRTVIEWGHSTCTDALAMALDAGVRRLGLFHLNRERTDAAMDAIVADCARILTEKNAAMDCFGVARDMTFTV